MNRETISTTAQARRQSPSAYALHPGYLPKERCVIWIRERNAYLQGVTQHALYTVAELSRALVMDGDRATDLAELAIAYHGVKAVLRTYNPMKQGAAQ